MMKRPPGSPRPDRASAASGPVSHSEQQLHAALATLEQCRAVLIASASQETAQLVSMAILQLRMKLNRITEAEWKAFCDAVAPDRSPDAGIARSDTRPRPTSTVLGPAFLTPCRRPASRSAPPEVAAFTSIRLGLRRQQRQRRAWYFFGWKGRRRLVLIVIVAKVWSRASTSRAISRCLCADCSCHRPVMGQMLGNQDGCNAAGVLTRWFVPGPGFGAPAPADRPVFPGSVARGSCAAPMRAIACCLAQCRISAA